MRKTGETTEVRKQRREPKKKNREQREERLKEEEKGSILQPVPALLPSPSPLASPGKVIFFSLFLCNCCKKTVRR
jgi:hypothetical protein